MGRRGALWLLAVLGLGLLGSWLGRAPEREARDAMVPSVARADYFMSGFTATTMGEAGRPRHRLSAERMTHFDDASTALEQPRLVLFRPGAPDWHLRAKRGWTEPDGDWIYLAGDVQLERPGEAGPTRVTSERMRVDPDRQYAETDAPVSVTRPGSRVDAIGMQAYGEQRRIIFLSEVRGIHEPARP